MKDVGRWQGLSANVVEYGFELETMGSYGVRFKKEINSVRGAQERGRGGAIRGCNGSDWSVTFRSGGISEGATPVREIQGESWISLDNFIISSPHTAVSVVQAE